MRGHWKLSYANYFNWSESHFVEVIRKNTTEYQTSVDSWCLNGILFKSFSFEFQHDCFQQSKTLWICVQLQEAGGHPRPMIIPLTTAERVSSYIGWIRRVITFPTGRSMSVHFRILPPEKTKCQYSILPARFLSGDRKLSST